MNGLKLCLASSLLSLAFNLADAAPIETVLLDFNGGNGSLPGSGMIADVSGNLYGSTDLGGGANKGMVFELSPPAEGKIKWTETVLYNFRAKYGRAPQGSLIADSHGNLYGTTGGGGAHNSGTVFELSPPAKGQANWTEAVLFNFKSTDGVAPVSGVISDPSGNLYGTTGAGGSANLGTVFRLTPPATGKTSWTETVLFNFAGSNGRGPNALIADASGNLYGTTIFGGTSGAGTVFKLSRPAKGKTNWTETVLCNFTFTNGSAPAAGLIADANGNFYGTTVGGGSSSGNGTVFELSPPALGKTKWTETVLLDFNDTNGSAPKAALIADASGNLYGTTSGGGPNNLGTVFKLAPPANGQTAWTETVLHYFTGTDGNDPQVGLIADASGNFYGTTRLGGAHNRGTVFKVTS